MNPNVDWTYRAERQLHFLLCQLPPPAASRIGVQAELSLRLAQVLRDAVGVIVLDLYLGFGVRPNEFTLLADVHYPQDDRGGTVVVKLADDARLRTECDAWNATRPPHFNGDSVFMRVTPIYHAQHQHRLVALVYQDAEPHIGLATQMFLEQAFLGAVRFGYPTVQSVVQVLETLFAHAAQHLYRGAGPADALNGQLLLNPSQGWPRRSLVDTFAAWTAADRVVITQLVNATLGTHEAVFDDPVEFFRDVADALATAAHDERFWFPLTRGPAHGDLHGRNVLVGVQDDRAERPAVYDYEGMSADNLVALDFAKLEVELKVRAYRHVFPYPWPFPDLPPPEYVLGIQDLERQLSESSESYVPAEGQATLPQQRLFALLRALRRQTAQYLGAASRRPDHWQREYLLMLAAYGVYSVKFTHTYSERTAAFVSAGVAAYRVLQPL